MKYKIYINHKLLGAISNRFRDEAIIPNFRPNDALVIILMFGFYAFSLDSFGNCTVSFIDFHSFVYFGIIELSIDDTDQSEPILKKKTSEKSMIIKE